MQGKAMNSLLLLLLDLNSNHIPGAKLYDHEKDNCSSKSYAEEPSIYGRTNTSLGGYYLLILKQSNHILISSSWPGVSHHHYYHALETLSTNEGLDSIIRWNEYQQPPNLLPSLSSESFRKRREYSPGMFYYIERPAWSVSVFSDVAVLLEEFLF